MSSARVAALVCEGQTDVPILRALIQQTWPALEEVRCLQPELDEMERAKGPAGWTQVKAWCEANAARLDEVLAPDLGDPIDLLVIAIDVDIAVEAGIADPPQHGVGVYETKRLRDTITAWLEIENRRNVPPAIVLSTPVMAVETWVIAALFRQQRSPESIGEPAAWLLERKKLRASPKDGTPWKELHLYRKFAARVATRVDHLRRTCNEAKRTLLAIERRRDELERNA